MKPCNHCAKRHPTYITCKEHAKRESQNREHVKPSKPDENDSYLEKPLPEKPQKDDSVKLSESIENDSHLSFRERERQSVQRWRENNREAYNAYMRDYRRKRRQEQ